MVRLPFADQAIVEERKLTEYLLNPTHPQGHSKAVFFGRLGFNREHPDLLRQALLQIARTADMEESRSDSGTKYVGITTLKAPSGREGRVATVWILMAGVPPPILVTAYPA